MSVRSTGRGFKERRPPAHGTLHGMTRNMTPSSLPSASLKPQLPHPFPHSPTPSAVTPVNLYASPPRDDTTQLGRQATGGLSVHSVMSGRFLCGRRNAKRREAQRRPLSSANSQSTTHDEKSGPGHVCSVPEPWEHRTGQPGREGFSEKVNLKPGLEG